MKASAVGVGTAATSESVKLAGKVAVAADGTASAAAARSGTSALLEKMCRPMSPPNIRPLQMESRATVEDSRLATPDLPPQRARGAAGTRSYHETYVLPQQMKRKLLRRSSQF